MSLKKVNFSSQVQLIKYQSYACAIERSKYFLNPTIPISVSDVEIRETNFTKQNKRQTSVPPKEVGLMFYRRLKKAKEINPDLVLPESILYSISNLKDEIEEPKNIFSFDDEIEFSLCDERNSPISVKERELVALLDNIEDFELRSLSSNMTKTIKLIISVAKNNSQESWLVSYFLNPDKVPYYWNLALKQIQGIFDYVNVSTTNRRFLDIEIQSLLNYAIENIPDIYLKDFFCVLSTNSLCCRSFIFNKKLNTYIQICIENNLRETLQLLVLNAPEHSFSEMLKNKIVNYIKQNKSWFSDFTLYEIEILEMFEGSAE
jgi:hypothetical protein